MGPFLAELGGMGLGSSCGFLGQMGCGWSGRPHPHPSSRLGAPGGQLGPAPTPTCLQRLPGSAAWGGPGRGHPPLAWWQGRGRHWKCQLGAQLPASAPSQHGRWVSVGLTPWTPTQPPTWAPSLFFPRPPPHPHIPSPEPIPPGPCTCPLQTKPGVIQPVAQAWPRGSPALRGRGDPQSVSALTRGGGGAGRQSARTAGGGMGGGCSRDSCHHTPHCAPSASPPPRPPLTSCPPT